MTVVRGDAARSLMARTRSARRQQLHSYADSNWSQSIDIDGPDRADVSIDRAAALLSHRLTGTPLAGRHGDIVIVMTELVRHGLAATGHVTLRVSSTPTDGVIVEVTDRAATPGGAAAVATSRSDRAAVPTRKAPATVSRLADSSGMDLNPDGMCTWARITSHSAC